MRWVSIPLWFDSNGALPLVIIKNQNVSIPLWFDSNLANDGYDWDTAYSFNSTLVRFKLSWRKLFHRVYNKSFNSTLVRFKPIFAVDRQEVRVCFNSTLVRFKLERLAAILNQIECFNSTLVRFKRWSQDINVCRRWGFQFHSGSIQTSPVWVVQKANQDVSIPLWFDSNRVTSGNASGFRRCFNSTLVRFKLPENQIRKLVGNAVSIPLWFDSNLGFCNRSEDGVIGFNSTLVRFKPWTVSINLRSPSCFNSTLVRFKPRWVEAVPRDEVLFQFHSGSIQTYEVTEYKPTYIGFNSTLVRFKLNGNDNMEGHLCVSIPLWFDSN